ncbi:hypothetical protein [Nibricoccus sp. IMCC34717]|uniref:hypothetical protein n=1 Tax=Nibricoccus sp. IMCC34717 TaxID=3034021 RepID=UPI00384FF711
MLTPRVIWLLALCISGVAAQAAAPFEYKPLKFSGLSLVPATAPNVQGSVAGYHPQVWGYTGVVVRGGTATTVLGFVPGAINGNGRVAGKAILNGSDEGAIQLRDLTVGTIIEVTPSLTSRLVALNNQDRVVYTQGDDSFVFDSGRTTRITPVPGLPIVSARGISNTGVVVGAMTNSAEALGTDVNRTESLRAFCWSPAGMTDLGTAGDDWCVAVGINDRGVILGVRGAFDSAGRGNPTFARIDPDREVVVFENEAWRAVPGFSHWVTPRAINNRGAIVGSDDGRGFIFEDGVVRWVDELVDMGAAGYQRITDVVAINEVGDLLVEVPGTFESTRVILERVCAGGEAAHFQNVSARQYVGRGEKIGIFGFTLGGTQPTRILIRGVGPTLNAFSVAGVLEDPNVLLFDSEGVLIASNDNWAGSDIAELSKTVGAFELEAGSKDAAMVVELNPGNYTLQISGAAEQTGVALLEAYAIP